MRGTWLRRWLAGLGLFGVLLLLLLVPVRADEVARLQYGATGYVTLDPARIQRPNDERLVLALFDTLTALDPKTGRAVPCAATAWKEALDGRSWTFSLDAKGTWSDGSPVKASDFVAAWRRALDPFEPSAWAPLFRAIDGVAAMNDADRALRAFSAASRALKDAMEEHPSGIPGKVIQEVVDRSGLGMHADGIDEPNLKRMLRWGGDAFPVDKADAARDAIRDARRDAKGTVYGIFDALGVTRGFVAKDDRTLVVHVVGRCPYLPQLVARAPFAPLSPKTLGGRKSAFDPREIVVNGAYGLKGRGARPRPGMENPDSAVHLKRRADYQGARPAHLDEVLCFTDQGPVENLRRLKAGEIQWLPDPRPGLRKRVEGLSGWHTRPTGRLVLLRLRADRPPFDDAKVRRAFAQALDRQALAKVMWPRPTVAPGLWPDRKGSAGAPGHDAKSAKAALKALGMDRDSAPWIELQFEERPGFDELADTLVAAWDKTLGIEMGLRIDELEEARERRVAGAYQIALGMLDAAFDDPAAWILPFEPGHPESGLGWDDAGFAALCRAARDVDAFLEGGEAALEGLPDPSALRWAVENAADGGDEAREHLRYQLLEAAESRLLESCVVIPLFRTHFGAVEQGVKDLGSDAAWAHPAFYGDLRSARL